MNDLVRTLEGLLSFPENGQRDEFCRLFAMSRKALEVEDDALRVLLKVSRPTVGRWARGDSAPHRFIRKPVLDALANEVDKKLRTYRTR